MNSQYVSYPPYYTYQSDSKKTGKFLKLFGHLPFLSSSTSSETKGLIGFSIFVAFILLLAICGIIGLSFMGSFFKKVDRLKNSDFSIDVQDAFQIQNQQLLDILRISQSNRTTVQKDAIEVEKIFIETKLGDHFKTKLDDNFKNVYNIRLLPNLNNDIIDVSYTVKTWPLPKKSIKAFRNSLAKTLSSENVYKNLLISQNSKIMSDNLNPIISDAIEGEVSGSLQSSSKISALRDTGDKKSSKKQITQEVFPSLIVEKPSTIFPHDLYMDKVDYDRKLYELNPPPTYFEPYENRYHFNDENFYEKKLSDENFSLESNSDLKQSILKPNPTTEKISIQKTNQINTSQSEHKITTKSTVTSGANVQKPNEVLFTPVFTTQKIKTLDEILQELINETMLKNSDFSR